MDIIEVYTDGGCEPNPGTGGWAFAINKMEYKKNRVENTTNNRMELTAVLESIYYVKEKYPRFPILIYSDSQYCVKGFNEWMHNWQKKGWNKKGGLKNKDIWKNLFDVRADVTMQWVKGHNGNEMNEFVDGLCNEAIYSVFKN